MLIMHFDGVGLWGAEEGEEQGHMAQLKLSSLQPTASVMDRKGSGVKRDYLIS